VIARLRSVLVTALVAGLMNLSPYEAPPRSLFDVPPGVVLPIGEPTPGLWR
jgi:hypothetical protein